MAFSLFKSAPRAEQYDRYNHDPKGKQIRNLALGRLRQFSDAGPYQSTNLLSMMYDDRDTEGVELHVYSVPDMGRPSFAEAVKGDFVPTHQGALFGPSWSTHWFRVTVRIPPRMKARSIIQFEWDAGCETLIYTNDGQVVHALTGGDGVAARHEYVMPSEWYNSNESHVFYLECAMNGMFGNGNGMGPPDPSRYFTLSRAEIAVPNVTALRLYWDWQTLSDCARELDEQHWQSHAALNACSKMMNLFQTGDQQSLKACRALAEKFLGPLRDSSAVYTRKPNREVHVFAIGHCHIDTAWLWPFSETRRKIARSWSSQLYLMDQYPEYRFCCSQAQQFKWLQQDHPRLFARLRTKVQTGQFQPIGGTWVEMDTNLPGGESLVRQFVFGQRYFEQTFGKRSTVFWLPDTFGYSTQMPQISRLAGCKYFFTQKLSWNNINEFPHSTFNWVGLDGSQVLAHMAPANAYDAQAQLDDVLRSAFRHKNLGESNASLLVFGNGDGGGGPNRAMLERLRRCRGAADTTEASVPRVEFVKSVDDFYSQIEESTHHGKTLKNWMGELYLELHRGCYTSQAMMKKLNRVNERMLHDVEYLDAVCGVYSNKHKRVDINHIWEDVLLCQFHDVLPGSAIGMVYHDAHKIEQKCLRELTLLRQKLMSEAEEIAALRWPKDPVVQCFFDTLPWPRSEIIREDGEYVKMTSSAKESTYELPGSCYIKEEGEDRLLFGNSAIRVTMVQGEITSLFDVLNNREVAVPGRRLNQYVVYEDQPLNWQAWDVELFHLDKPTYLSKPSSVVVVDKDPLLVSVETLFKLSKKSSLRVITSVADFDSASGYSPAVSFTCHVDWHESHKFLKAEFPVDVHSDTAAYETQYGLTRRPTHFNTSWDQAKFEVVCHRFADLSEFNYGVSILNDCKYGFATHGNVMRLSLLRAPKQPDDNADMGTHTFRYAIVPHSGPLTQTKMVEQARNFNHPPLPEDTKRVPLPLAKSLVQTDSPNVVVDWVKLADNDTARGAIVVRIYEAYGGKTTTKLTTTLPISKAVICSLLEDEWETISVRKSTRDEPSTSVALTINAFEVKTIKLVLIV